MCIRDSAYSMSLAATVCEPRWRRAWYKLVCRYAHCLLTSCFGTRGRDFSTSIKSVIDWHTVDWAQSAQTAQKALASGVKCSMHWPTWRDLGGRRHLEKATEAPHYDRSKYRSLEWATSQSVTPLHANLQPLYVTVLITNLIAIFFGFFFFFISAEFSFDTEVG